MIYRENDEMKYDLENHRYFITSKQFAEAYGIDINACDFIKDDIAPEYAADRFFKRISRILYSYIERHNTNNDPDLMKYIIARGYMNKRRPDGSLSKYYFLGSIKEAMNEIAYAMTTSGNDPQLLTGITPAAKQLDYNDILKGMIPVSAHVLLKSAGLIDNKKIYTSEDYMKLQNEKEW